MKNNHLTYFKIENFKKFNSLEVNDIGQFNLIVGDNNVGKTCLLEALCFDLNSKKLLSALHFIYSKRKIFISSRVNYAINDEEFNYNYNLIGLSQIDKNKPLRIYKKILNQEKLAISVENKTSFNPLDDSETRQFVSEVDLFQYKGLNQLSKNWLVFKNETYNQNEKTTSRIVFLSDVTSSYYKDFYNYLNYLPLIRLDDLYDDDLIRFFKKIVKNPKDEDKLVELLNKIFKDLTIKRLAIFEYFNGVEFLQVSTNKKEDYHPITEYGDGFIKILRVIFELLFKENNFICIDEIDAGIHHTKQKEFWLNIITVCKDLGVQLFASTHSKECAMAYVEAIKLIEDKNLNQFRLIELYESKNEIFSGTVSDVDSIEYSVKNLPFRGENIYD